MAHTCPECQQACYCDGEDTWFDDPEDCIHECAPEEYCDDYEEVPA